MFAYLLELPGYVSIPLIISLAIVGIYTAVRVGSIAHFRTRAEFEREEQLRRKLNADKRS